MNGTGAVTPLVALPAMTPWRTITIGKTLAPIVETTIANDLVKPKYEASKDYTYGKGSWSWIIGMDPSCNFDEQKRYIDFSAPVKIADAPRDEPCVIRAELVKKLSAAVVRSGLSIFLPAPAGFGAAAAGAAWAAGAAAAGAAATAGETSFSSST